ncbi:hypothetical protein SH449x_003743 [Pirellulaceae bacterium SH449]
MLQSRRSKKRKRFLWPEIGLLILGLLGFNPSLLLNAIGIDTEYASRTLTQQSATSPRQGTQSSPSLSYQPSGWGTPAVPQQTAHSLGNWPSSAQQLQTSHYLYQPPQTSYPHGYPNTTQQQFGVSPQEYARMQQAIAAQQQAYYSSPPQYWVTSNQNSYNMAGFANPASGQGTSNRVPPVDYQSNWVPQGSQLRTATPFPSTALPSENSYGANVRKEGTQLDPSRTHLAGNPYAQAPHVSTQQWATPTQQQSPTSSTPNYDRYIWGAVDPRASNNQRPATQGSWASGVSPPSPANTSRLGRY